MKNIFYKKLMSLVMVSAIAASSAAIPLSAAAAAAPEADTGAVGEISNGGEWTIYASKVGQYRSDRDAIVDPNNSGQVEVTKDIRSAALQFDLSTKDKEDRVIKSAKLRLTPMVSKSNLTQSVSVIGNEFSDTTIVAPIAQFLVPRVGSDDFFKQANLQELTNITEYPAALSAWQTDIDVTGTVITAGEDNLLSLYVEYASGNTNKTEYATCDIAGNTRLNNGAIPFLYSDGKATEYSKWIYPQIVFTYTDEAEYKSAYADFVEASKALSRAIVSETKPVSAPKVTGGSTVTLSAADDVGIVTVQNNTIAYNSSYSGSAEKANIELTVTNGEASYSRIIPIDVDAEASYPISFDADKNPLGEQSVTVGDTTYKDGTAYAKEGDNVIVNAGANMGYRADITVKKEDGSEVESDNGSFVMPAEPVSVEVEYSKMSVFGTTRVAATNSISIKGDGQLQSPDLVIGADRVTFVKFDLSGYNAEIISNAEISFNLTKNATLNTKAVFFVPNNDWSESNFNKNFKLDGTDDTDISNFKYTADNGTENSVSLLNGTNHQTLIIPNGDDASTAAKGILKDFYVGSTGTRKTCSFGITKAVKEALDKNTDGIVTFMIYSTGSGNDVYSVNHAGSLEHRPSLTITESAEYLPDDELITEIKTPEDLETLAAIVNGGNTYEGKTVTLANNIDLTDRNWTPIGTQDTLGAKPFAGTFEGGNHSITGLNINTTTGSTQGLFGIVTGTIQNLTVSGEINASSVVGGIAAACSGSIKHCIAIVNITARREAGGIVGTLSNGGIISNSQSTGNIKISDKETYAGGIAGHNIEGIVENCTNSGTITNDEYGFRNSLGGIVGFLDNGEVRGSINEGAVASDAEVALWYTGDESQNYTGGIIGYGSYSIIKNSSNSGTVRNAVDYAGGVAGLLQKGNIISKCTNSGSISGRDNVGGIVGCNNSTVMDCSSTGEVTATGEAAKRKGGIVGYLLAGEVRNCPYNGDLEVVGLIASEGKVTNLGLPTENRVTYSDGNAIVSVKEAETFKLLFVGNTANGMLRCTDVQTVKFDAAGEEPFSPYNFRAKGASNIKVMLWNDLEVMVPASEPDER